ncbi:MAG TPA: response regulator [Burkholderiales bacterium]|nr:response regulator [Burkholderiales bacterium]
MQGTSIDNSGRAGATTERRGSVLIAEDDEIILAALTRGLEQAGYAVAGAHSGEEAIELGLAGHFDLAIVDVRLPGISGIAAARRIHEETGMPFVVLSSFSNEQVVAEANAAGAIGYLVKPLDVKQMLPEIKTALERSADLRRLAASEAGLAKALNQSRDISIAIGIIMERLHLGRDPAFERLRKAARDRRQKLHDLAAEIIGGQGKAL